MKTLRESLLDIDGAESRVELIIKIDNWCKNNIQGNYEIDKNTLVINSSSSITIANKELERFPSYIHFGIVQGNFHCNHCTSLKSLEGAPKEVGTNFYCNNCTSLKSLEGAPEKISNDFYCGRCTSLKSLDGFPKEVGGSFSCKRCPSLKSFGDISTHIRGKIYAGKK